MAGPANEIEFVRVINGARFELEAAGNPSYAVVLVDETGEAHLSPMVFATIGPAADHGKRVATDAAPSDRVYVVSRSAAAKRAVFSVVEPKTLKKLHQRIEVIEETFIETDRTI